MGLISFALDSAICSNVKYICCIDGCRPVVRNRFVCLGWKCCKENIEYFKQWLEMSRLNLLKIIKHILISKQNFFLSDLHFMACPNILFLLLLTLLARVVSGLSISFVAVVRISKGNRLQYIVVDRLATIHVDIKYTTYLSSNLNMLNLCTNITLPSEWLLSTKHL